MPRVAGQIDLAKNEAILDAAADMFAERGLAVGMEDVARRACVSKQTIYNHYGSKAELVRALATRRVMEITAGLDRPGAVEDPHATLAAFGRELLDGLFTPRSRRWARLTIIGATDWPEVAATLHEAGSRASGRRLAQFLTLEHEAGRLTIPDPEQAAGFFVAMVIGPFQMPSLLGVQTTLGDDEIEATAREAASRFLRAYARL